MELLPSIDLREGRVVRLLHGDDARRTVYDHDPEALLAGFAAAGVERLHLVDLDAAFGERPQRPLVARLAAVARRMGLAVQLGGGLRDGARVAWALEEAGCQRAVVGSMVAREAARFAALARRHPGRLVPAVEAAGDELRVAGWRETAPDGLEAVCRRLRGLPCPAVLVTDVGRDGALAGPNLELARRVAELAGLPALLSGGARSPADLAAAREQPGIAGVVVGRALYDGAFTLEQALAACRGSRERGAEVAS